MRKPKQQLKVFLLIGLFWMSCFLVKAQAGEWTWMNGDSNYNSQGYFGTKGVPSPLNSPPSLYEACEWTDLQGNFWLYGGLSVTLGNNTVAYSDLWKYNPVTNEWTWIFGSGLTIDSCRYGVKGIASPNNSPGWRTYGTGTWVDLQGNLWLYGGFTAGWGTTFSQGIGADLWKYDILTNQWTWVNGTNVFYLFNNFLPVTQSHPGSREEFSTTWTDNVGNLWLYGGLNDNVDTYGDLWRYEISSDTWTLMKGDTTPNPPPNYGTKGVPNPANSPGRRDAYSKWKDVNGDLWFFGGGDRISGSMNNQRNDLWKYSVATNEWTWMSGSTATYASGNYGSKCIPSPNNEPKARLENRACWTDKCGNFWTFGGYIFGATFAALNDLWMYNYSLGEWTWVSGSSTTNAANIYGTKGISSPTNSPGGRGGSVGWSDLNGNLWLFGGRITTSASGCNDLWRYIPDSTCSGCFAQLPIINLSSTDTSFCEKHCIDFYDLSTNNPTSWQWFFPGADSTTSSLQNPTNICYNQYGSFDVTLIACNAAGCDTLYLPGFINEYQTLTPTITQSNDTLFSSPGFGYQWWSVDSGIIAGATNNYFIPTQHGSYYVIVTDSNGCAGASNTIIITGINQISNFEFPIFVTPNPNDGSFTISFNETLHKDFSLRILNSIGQTINNCQWSIVNGQKAIVNLGNAPKGIYAVEVINGDKIYRGRFVVQ